MPAEKLYLSCLASWVSCGLIAVSSAVGGVPEILPSDMLVLTEAEPEGVCGNSSMIASPPDEVVSSSRGNSESVEGLPLGKTGC